eukprot:TRINITY_DN10061_c0_g1_i1.p3 TRINITY_DN10061_c0_g1~~TRINITY_DN10061_c0_g1_i1.p3  ORF type:complete len:53 (-),score=7.07 TRINITY_DN10061_c0_g1_i1:14-172(-)
MQMTAAKALIKFLVLKTTRWGNSDDGSSREESFSEEQTDESSGECMVRMETG